MNEVMNVIYEELGIIENSNDIDYNGYMYLDYRYFYSRLNENDMIIEELNKFNLEFNILNEGIAEIGKAIWEKILALFKKIKTAFKNFILNINYLKNAKLPKQQVDDLLYCLNASQNRSFNYVKTFTRYYKISTLINRNPNKEVSYAITNGPSDNRLIYVTTLNDELINYTQEINKNLESLENSKQYDRIKENNYKKENIIDVPLTNIISDMKRCNKELADAEGQLPQCIRLADKFKDNKTWNDVSKKMVSFLKQAIQYFNKRIQLLNTFFKSAKLSLKAVKNNIMDYKKFKSYIDTNPNMSNFKYWVNPKKISVKFGLANDLLLKMRESNRSHDMKNYENYYKQTCNLFHLKNGCSFNISTNESFPDLLKKGPEDNAEFIVSIMDYKYETVYFGSKPLYHQAIRNDITELIPTAVSNDELLFHRTGRVYLHLSIPLNRYGSNSDKDIDSRFTKFKYRAKSSHIYKVKDRIQKGYKDPEIARSAIFVETENPIKVEKTSLEEYKKDVEKYFQ